jgi:BioD-like phosphotransacetylase family protein
VAIVALGGIGRPIDEIVLNKTLFDEADVPLVGVILNKVKLEKLEKIKKFARIGLEKKGIEFLGAIPFDPILWSPTFQEVVKDIGAIMICGEKNSTNSIDNIIVGAALPHTSVEYFANDTLLITPGDREDLIVTALAGSSPGVKAPFKIAGLILTCGIKPPESILSLVRRAEIPTACVSEDTFSTASKLNQAVFKIWPEDTKKINEAAKVIEDYVDVDKLCGMIGLG